MGMNSEFQEQLEKFKIDGSNIDFFSSFAYENLRSDPEYVKEIMEQVLEIAEKKNYQIACANCLIYIGWYYHDMSDFEKALDYHTRANSIFTDVGDDAGNILTCNALMADCMQMGFYDLSLEWGLRGINLAESTNNMDYFVPLLLNTGESYIQLKYYNEAKRILNQLNVLNYKLSKGNSIILNQAMAEIELYSGDLDKAMAYAGKAYEISKDSGLNSLTAEVLRIYAEIYVQYKNYSNAEKYFEKAAQLSQESKEMNVYCSILIGWGRYHRDLEKLESAEEKLLDAIKIATEIKSKPSIINAYKELGEVYKKLKNYEKAIECIENHEEYEKEIFNKQNNTWIARMQDSQTKHEAAVYKTLYDQIGRISIIGQKITSDLNLNNILDTIYNEAKHLFAADIFGIATFNEAERNLDYALFIEKGQRVNAGFVSIDDGSSLGAYCINNKTEIIINDYETEYHKYVPNILRHSCGTNTPRSLIFCPLMLGNKVTGFISVQSYNKNAYNVNDLNTMRILASYVAIALENATLFKEIEYSAAHDYLTGLLNRREIFKEGTEAFNRFTRYDEDICVIMIDIDNFKKVNDTYGHIVGDEVIKKIAEVIKTNIRRTDFAGRYGGEEFIIVLSHSDINMAVESAERVRRTIEACRVKCNELQEVRVTISLGVFQYTKDVKSFEEGVDLADGVLYRAKRSGKNKVIPYPGK